MSVVVDTDTVVDPRTVAGTWSALVANLGEYEDLLVVFGHAAATCSTVLASERCANGASGAKIELVVLPQAEELVNYCLLLGNAVHLWHIARIVSHGGSVEEHGEAEEDGEQEVEQGMSAVVRRRPKGRAWQYRGDPVESNKKQRAGKDACHPWL